MKKEILTLEQIKKHKKLFIREELLNNEEFESIIDKSYYYYEKTRTSGWCKGDNFRDYADIKLIPIIEYIFVLDDEFTHRKNLSVGNKVMISDLPRRILKVSDDVIEIEGFSENMNTVTDIYSVKLIKTNLKHLIDFGYKKTSTNEVLGDTYIFNSTIDMFYVYNDAKVEPVEYNCFKYLNELENYIRNIS